jgi:hypothetical protein
MVGIKVVTPKLSRLASSELSRATPAVQAPPPCSVSLTPLHCEHGNLCTVNIAGLYNGEFSDTHTEGNASSSFHSRGLEWMHQFADSQVGENNTCALPDRSKHYGYAQVSIKGARHENQDALYSDGQLFGIYDGHGGKSAAAFSHSEVARCFYSEHTRLSAAATKSLDTDCVTNDDEDILPTAVKVRRWILPFSRRN